MWLKRVGVVIASIFCIFSGALVFAPHRDISTNVLITAPPNRVWAVLTGLPDYPAWNPEMVLKGDLVPGAVIENIECHGPDQNIFWPTILVVKPDQELRWSGHLLLAGRFWLPRIFDAEHYFLLQPASNGGTVFTQGEKFQGIVLWIFDVNQLLPEFRSMNAALKARSEVDP